MLALLVAVTGVLSAIFTNDAVCLAMAPVWIDACRRRRLDPVPFLLGLACAANVGAAATLIGNPQKMLIGQTLALSFNGYFAHAAPPTALGLVVVWVVIAAQQRRSWSAPMVASEAMIDGDDATVAFDAWQTAKGLAVAATVALSNLVSNVPAVMLLLPHVQGPAGGTLLALVGTPPHRPSPSRC